jgi:hypothetical protein
VNIPKQIQFGHGKSLSQIQTAIQKIWQQAAKAVNGNISFGNSTSGSANIAGKWIPFTTVTGSDIILTHNLGYLPTGYIVMSKSGFCDFHDGTTPWTITTISIQASVAGVTGWVFVI